MHRPHDDPSSAVGSAASLIGSTLTVTQAMRRALALALRGPAGGANPQVGAVILSPSSHAPSLPPSLAPSPTPTHPEFCHGTGTKSADSVAKPKGSPRGADAEPVGGSRGAGVGLEYRVLGEGWHRGAGTAHAEVAALAAAAEAGHDVRGATAVVSLQPCNATGRTGPCTRALIDAGIAEVVFAATDPLAEAAGSTATLESAGVRVHPGLLAEEGVDLLHPWLTSVRLGRPYVTLKLATTLDGRVAARDGTSRWITGPQARAHAHAVRQTVGAILVGTGTVAADDPWLTARTPEGGLAERQPLRVVVGERAVPDGARLRGPGGALVQIRTHDMGRVLAELGERGVRHVLVEGGPTLSTAFLAAGVVDEVHAYLAPVALGAGLGAIGDLGVRTMADAPRWRTHHVGRLGDDVLLVARRAPEDALRQHEPPPHEPQHDQQQHGED